MLHTASDNCLMLNPVKQDTNRKESAAHQDYPHFILFNFSSENHTGLEGESSIELKLQMSTKLDKKKFPVWLF